MKFSSQYEKRPPVPNQGRRGSKKPVNPATVTVVVGFILAILIVLSALLVHHFRQKEKEYTPPTTTAPTLTVAPATDAADGWDEVPASGAETTVLSGETTTASDSATTTAPSAGSANTHPYVLDMYSTTVTLNVRSMPDANSQKIGMVGQDKPIKVTGHTDNGWYEVDVDGTKGYVSDQYLVEAPQLKEHSASPYYIKVNRKQNLVIVLQKNAQGEYQKPVKAFVCSVGLDNKTPTGTFVCSDHYNWRLLSGNVYGQYAVRIDGHYLFHSVPYVKQAKDTLEYEEYNKLGSPASLGCIRLSVEDAKWIHDNCPAGTVVTIYDSDQEEPLPKPTPVKIDVNDNRRGWDPTDPDAKNPWKSAQ